MAEFLDPANAQRWVCASHGRSSADAIMHSCKSTGIDQNGPTYSYVYSIVSTTEPPMMPYESLGGDSEEGYRFAPFLISVYPKLTIEMLSRTTGVASFIDMGQFPTVSQEIMSVTVGDYLNDTSGYSLVEHGKIARGDVEHFQVYFSTLISRVC
jgi:hypothetical protein